MSVTVTGHVATLRTRWRVGAWPLGALCLVAACGGAVPDTSESASSEASGGSPHEVTITREQIQHGGVRWEPVRATTMTDAVEVPAQLAPNEDRTARLGSPARARVITVHVRIGDRVSRDQPLVTLQSEQASAARAESAKAVAELTAHQTAARYARTALERAERLLELKAVSRQDVERARVEADEAESARVQAQVDVERAQVTLRQLGVSEHTGEILVRTPLAGIVLSREAAPGSVVEAGAPLMTVSDPATLWLDIAATERIVPALRPGNQVQFTVPQLGPQIFDARIENVGGAFDPTTRTLPVHAVVPNTRGSLRPAMFASVTLPLGPPTTGVAVPDGALQLLDERPVLFVVHPDGSGGARFERRDVEVGARTGTEVQIVQGVGPGEVVVTEGAFAVKSEFARSTMPPD